MCRNHQPPCSAVTYITGTICTFFSTLHTCSYWYTPSPEIYLQHFFLIMLPRIISALQRTKKKVMRLYLRLLFLRACKHWLSDTHLQPENTIKRSRSLSVSLARQALISLATIKWKFPLSQLQPVCHYSETMVGSMELWTSRWASSHE